MNEGAELLFFFFHAALMSVRTQPDWRFMVTHEGSLVNLGHHDAVSADEETRSRSDGSSDQLRFSLM